MKKIVLTGGPCAGKSTVLSVLAEDFGKDVGVVPEAATMLLSSGFPVPGKDIKWSREWQNAFQSAILSLQLSLEAAYELKAEEEGKNVLVCDRGILDGAAYYDGGQEAFCRIFGLDIKKSLERYDTVIHLESLAIIDRGKYKIQRGNNRRIETSVAQAIKTEKMTIEAWSGHGKRIIVDGKRGLDGKISEVFGIIKHILSAKN